MYDDEKIDGTNTWHRTSAELYKCDISELEDIVSNAILEKEGFPTRKKKLALKPYMTRSNANHASKESTDLDFWDDVGPPKPTAFPKSESSVRSRAQCHATTTPPRLPTLAGQRRVSDQPEVVTRRRLVTKPTNWGGRRLIERFIRESIRCIES